VTMLVGIDRALSPKTVLPPSCLCSTSLHSLCPVLAPLSRRLGVRRGAPRRSHVRTLLWGNPPFHHSTLIQPRSCSALRVYVQPKLMRRRTVLSFEGSEESVPCDWSRHRQRMDDVPPATLALYRRVCSSWPSLSTLQKPADTYILCVGAGHRSSLGTDVSVKWHRSATGLCRKAS
jgi:hypothetical protein